MSNRLGSMSGFESGSTSAKCTHLVRHSGIFCGSGNGTCVV